VKRHTPVFSRPFSRDEAQGDFPEYFQSQEGITARDHIAIAAMQGMLADPNVREFAWVAKNSYEMADFMLKESERSHAK
jgi:hypothetical protein